MTLRNIRNWGGALGLFTAAASMAGCQIKAAPEHVADPPLKIQSVAFVPPTAMPVEEITPADPAPGMNSKVLPNAYKYCHRNTYASGIMDAVTGEMKYGVHENKRVDPASLTKWMTMFILFEQIQRGRIGLDDPVPVSKNYRYAGTSSSLEIKKNDKITVRQVLLGGALRSARDCMDIVETIVEDLSEKMGIDKKEFVTLMNERAKTLGMVNTHYTNSSGMPDPKMYTSAKDQLLLFRAMLQFTPELCEEILAQKEFFFRIPIKNKALIDGSDMGKTGTIDNVFNIMNSFIFDGGRSLNVVLEARNSNFGKRHALDLRDEARRLLKEDTTDRSAFHSVGKLSHLPQKRDISELPDMLIPVAPTHFAASRWPDNGWHMTMKDSGAVLPMPLSYLARAVPQ